MIGILNKRLSKKNLFAFYFFKNLFNRLVQLGHFTSWSFKIHRKKEIESSLFKIFLRSKRLAYDFSLILKFWKKERKLFFEKDVMFLQVIHG